MLRLNAQTKGVDVDNARCSCKGYSTGLLPVSSRHEALSIVRVTLCSSVRDLFLRIARLSSWMSSRTAFRWESALCIFAFGREAALPEKLNLLVRLFAEKVEFYFILFGG